MPNSLLWIGLVVLWVFVLFPMLAGRRPRIRRINDSALETRVLHRGGDPRLAARGMKRWQDHDEESADEEHWEEAEFHDDFVPDRRGRGGYDPEADRLARAARYRFRQRATLALALTALICTGMGMVINRLLWSVAAAAVVILVAYLVYLRHQVRLEEEIRRRRAARLARARSHPDDDDEDPAAPPERFRRLGGTVLELDDEDPIFDHLDTYDTHRIRERPEHPDEFRRVVGE